MFSSIPGHYSLPVISNFLPIVAMKNVSRHCQRVLWGQNCPQWRTAVLWGHLRSSCPPPLPIVPSLSPLRSLLPCKYFHDASQLRFRALSAMLFGIINLSLVTGKIPKQFKSNYFSVTANIASRSVSHWLSYQGQNFPDSFSFLMYALTWFGSSLMVQEIMKSKIKQMLLLFLTSNQCSPGQGPLIFSWSVPLFQLALCFSEVLMLLNLNQIHESFFLLQIVMACINLL